MTEPILYIRGSTQWMSFETMPEELLDDLKAIIGLSDEMLAELHKHLTEAEGFLDPKAMLATIQGVVKDQNTTKAVWRVLRNISPSQVERMVTSLDEKSKEKGFPFDQAKLERLKQILKKLIRPYTALARFKKAENLAN